MKIASSALQQAKDQTQQTPEQKLKDVSSMYEKHFLNEMFKAMRATVNESGFIKKNQAEEIFREQLDQNYVDKWSEKGGIGLQNIIYDQLVEKYGAQLGIKKNEAKPVGPLPIQAKDFTATRAHSPKAYDVGFKFERGKAAGAQELISPWSGTITNKITLSESNQVLELQHENGLKSQLVFGGLSNIQTGTKVEAGQTLGLLSPEARAFYWNLQKDPALVSE